MTVREMMERLAQMDQNAVVRFPDTYAQAEGWDEGHETATIPVIDMVMENGEVVLTGDIW